MLAATVRENRVGSCITVAMGAQRRIARAVPSADQHAAFSRIIEPQKVEQRRLADRLPTSADLAARF